MYTVADFEKYFRYLAAQHPELLHSEVSGQRVFEVLPMEQAFSDVRTELREKSYVMRLLLPTMELKAHHDDALKAYEFGLMVARYHGTREADPQDVIAALGAAERVADELWMRLLYDVREGYPLFQGTRDSADGLELAGSCESMTQDGSYSGVLYMFRLHTPRCIDVAATDWADGGTTPTPLPD